MTELSRRLLLVTMAVLVLVMLAAVVKWWPDNDGRSLETVSVRLKWLFVAHYSESLVAKEEGYWSRRGLDVSIHPGGFENDSIKLVASGSDDFGITGASDLLIARAKDIPIVAIAGVHQDTAVVFVTRANSGIAAPSDFQGKRIAVKVGTDVDTQYRVMLQRAGIKPDAITEVPVKFDLGPFVNDQVDVFPGYAMNEPITLKARGIEIHTILAKNYGISSYGTVLFTTAETIAKRPDTVQRFVDGYLDGLNAAIQDPDKAVEYTLKYNEQLDPDIQRQAIRATIPYWKPNGDIRPGEMSRQKWTETLHVLQEHQLVPAEFDIQRAFDNRFIKEHYGTR